MCLLPAPPRRRCFRTPSFRCPPTTKARVSVGPGVCTCGADGSHARRPTFCRHLRGLAGPSRRAPRARPVASSRGVGGPRVPRRTACAQGATSVHRGITTLQRMDGPRRPHPSHRRGRGIDRPRPRSWACGTSHRGIGRRDSGSAHRNTIVRPGFEVSGAGAPSTAERHYTVHELSREWNLSPDYIRRMFADEPGVLLFTKRRMGRRTYRILRIPASIAERVYRRSQVAR